MKGKPTNQGNAGGVLRGRTMANYRRGGMSTMPYSNMPKGATQSPKGDLGMYRQEEGQKVGGGKFKNAGPTVAASKAFKGMGDVMSKM